MVHLMFSGLAWIGAGLGPLLLAGVDAGIGAGVDAGVGRGASGAAATDGPPACTT